MIDLLTLALVAAVLLASAHLGDGTLARRALAVLAVMLGTTVLVSSLLRLVPGDPVASILGDQAPEESRRALARELNLVDDEGRPVGVVAQTAGFVRGSAAAVVLAMVPARWEERWARTLPEEPRSFRTREPVRRLLAARLPRTLRLAAAAIVIAIVLGVGLGAVAAAAARTTGRGRILAGAADAFALIGVAMPRIWLGPLLILVFSLKLRVVPPAGDAEGLRSLALPAIALGTALAALLARMTRGALLDVLSADFVRSARARGLSPARVVLRHALPSALPPVITVVGLQVGGLLAGAVVTEKIFSWPGVGLLMLESIQRLDVPVVQGVVLVVALGAALSTLAAEALVRLIDPRLRRAA